MLDHFPAFAAIVHRSFQSFVSRLPGAGEVFVTDVDGDALFAAYLAAFPEGTNPLFRERSEHDCSCCKQFVRRAGMVVAVEESGAIRTIWDLAADEAPYPYNIVAGKLRDAVRAKRLTDLFRVGLNEPCFGAEVTRSLEKDGRAREWNHFHSGEIPKALRSATPDQVRGDFRTTVQVFERGLVELKAEAVETVLGLIDANGLYRGEEHRRAVAEFQAAQKGYRAATAPGAPEHAHDAFLWTRAKGPAARFRNTVIGTLVQDLSEAGADLERAVKAFETKVAPTNYKRTTALITPGMVKKAMETIQALGLEPALERRFARIEDVSVTDVLWVDGKAKALMKGGIGDVLMAAATKAPAKVDESRVEEIGVEAFIRDVLPEAGSMEVLFKGAQIGNLCSLTAPVNAPAIPYGLFRWSNDFAWSYCGNVADSIRERVKKAGGKVEGAALRVSLSWFNYDDLDLHVFEPGARIGSRGHIHFRNKISPTGGYLDVDMNAGSGQSREAVENVAWTNAPKDGVYSVVVHNFHQREASDPGFTIEVESNGAISHYSYTKGVRNGAEIPVAKLHVRGGVVERVEPAEGISSKAISQEKWGLTTEQFVKVNAVTLSPNHWACGSCNGSGSISLGRGGSENEGGCGRCSGTGRNAVGNKHVFFVLDGAKNDEPTRGIYNEFLHPRLEQHRKVFEVIGDKTKCQPTEGQLSGLGFSSTKPDGVTVKVTGAGGKRTRMFSVRIGA